MQTRTKRKEVGMKSLRMNYSSQINTMESFRVKFSQENFIVFLQRKGYKKSFCQKIVFIRNTGEKLIFKSN